MEKTLLYLPDEAQRLASKIKKADLDVKLLGGLAIWMQSPSARKSPLNRSYGDLDFITTKREIKFFIKLMSEAGYIEDKRFNAIHGKTRLILLDQLNARPVDILIDTFKMCHEINFKNRLKTNIPTISLADLLLTKLQITKITSKDIVDIASLLLDHEFDKNAIDIDYILRLLGNDWGFEHTVLITLANFSHYIDELELDMTQRKIINLKSEFLLSAIKTSKKSITYRVRETIGEKLPWAEEPEELQH